MMGSQLRSASLILSILSWSVTVFASEIREFNIPILENSVTKSFRQAGVLTQSIARSL